MVEGSRFELLKALPADLQSAPFGRSGNPPNQIDGRILIENPLVSSKIPFFLPWHDIHFAASSDSKQ